MLPKRAPEEAAPSRASAEERFLTRTITLPISGKEAVIREGDGYAERILYADNAKFHKKLPKYWAHLTLSLGGKAHPTDKDILDLLVPDQQVLAIEIHKFNYGSMLQLRGKCGSCGKPSNYEVDLDKLPLIPLPDGASGPDPTFEVRLPRSGKRVRFGYSNGHAEMEEADAVGFDPNRVDLSRIKEIDGVDHVSYEMVISLPLIDHRALREAIASKKCGYDMDVNFVHSCGASVSQNLITDPSFLMPGLL
jgi:hypothetical protein